MSVTTVEIARRVGVSHATVCDVLNDRWQRKRISRQTFHRVSQVARELNYRPNRLARSLLTGQSHTLALVMPSISHSFFPHIALGVEMEAKKHGYHVLLSHVIDGLEDEAAEIEVLLQRRVDGLIIAPRYGAHNRAKYRELLREQVPFVFVNDYFDDVACPAIIGDDYNGMYRATEHLIQLGHRRIAHLAGNRGPTTVQMRVDGYGAAMRAHGLPVPDGYVQGFVERTTHTAYDDMQRLLARLDRPTAVTAASDNIALMGMRAVWDAGLRVPQDLALVGYGDDIEQVWSQKVPLTTVRVDAEQMGRHALARLLEEMCAPGTTKVVEKLPAELVVRESCGSNAHR